MPGEFEALYMGFDFHVFFKSNRFSKSNRKKQNETDVKNDGEGVVVFR